jgi:hypothetical protein
MARALAALLAILLIGNGLYMLIQPEPWYLAVPGVTETGPFNRHFIMDVGAAYALAGAGAAWAAWRPARGWAALAAGAAFQAAHALIHLWDAAAGHGAGTLVRDFPGVFLPTLVALLLVFLLRPRERGREAA